MPDPLGVALVGCGLVGGKRAAAIAASRAGAEVSPSARLIVCADLVQERAAQLAQRYFAKATDDWREAVARPDVDVVIAATTNDALALVTIEAVNAGKHVLVEKPAARRRAELDAVRMTAEARRVLVRVGFNHRYHPALRQARALADAGAIGELMFVRGRYGHGGRPGYEREWRADPARSGGGELIDQGVHLIDLARWFLLKDPDEAFEHVFGWAHTYYWDMPVEDNAFMLLRTSSQRAAFLHVSCTEWKNLFSFEVYGRGGKLEIQGLGGSYGIERLVLYKMRPEDGAGSWAAPELTTFEYPAGDDSWQVEWEEFVKDIQLGRAPAVGIGDAHAALTIVEEIYQRTGGAQGL